MLSSATSQAGEVLEAGEDLSEFERPVFTVAIPCYNETGAIRETIEHIRGFLAGRDDWELVVVNDGSTDGSGQLLEAIEADDPTGGRLVVIHHERNRGYGAALKTAIRHARGDYVIITDADGTYPNERLGEFMDQAGDADMVVGARIGADVTYSKIRAIPKIFLRRYAQWIARREIPDLNSGMRIFRKDVAETFINILPNGFSFTTTITLAMMTNYYDVKFVPIGYKMRVGKSKIKPIRDTIKFMQLIVRTGMYFAPMRVIFPVSMVFLLAGVVSGCIDVWLADLTEKTLFLTTVGLNAAAFALLADMIEKRTAGAAYAPKSIATKPKRARTPRREKPAT